MDAGAWPTATSPPPEKLGAAAPAGAARVPRSASGAFGHGRFSPGTPLGDRYRIVGLLGKGGMGEVYRADDLHLGQPVALKFLPADVERDPVRLERFIAEVRTARQISHPNICRVYDLGEFEGRRFLSMEYIDGEDLRSLLRRIGRLPEDKGLQIARQLCAGLAAMHDRGVLHRDLKPANVMIDGDGRVRLTDFGLAAAAADATGRPSTGSGRREIAGTPAYMAPEQLAGEALSPQTDLYALGLLLFEVFTGERVHRTDRPDEPREQHRASGTTPLSKTSGAALDPAIGRVIERCLERDPSRRPASAIAVAAALPGGDPLAAALAAGETPSPQMVAAAGEPGTLPAKVGVPLLLAFLILAGLAAWFNGRRLYTSVVPFPYSAEVLATKAREMLGRLGYQETPADSGLGFRTDSAYVTWVMKHDSSRTRWQQLASRRPAPVQFWYRTSPTNLVPTSFVNGAAGVVLGFDDPPLTKPGMTCMNLDLSGRLQYLEAVMPKREPAAPAVAAPDWSRLFVEAGLDMAAFQSVPPEWKAPAGADARAAWVGPGADANGAELRVEAAAHRGRPVFFLLSAQGNESASSRDATAQQPRAAAIFVALFLGIPGLAILLALRNVRSNRADRHGATRLALAIGLIVLGSGVLQSHFTFSFDDIWIFVTVASWAAFMGLLTWTFYVALEPYARRRWPQMLVSWNRLLEGRWRDPLVGRDLLIGTAISVVIELLLDILASFEALPSAPAIFAKDAWTGLSQTLASLPYILPETVWQAFGLVLLLVGMRIVFRREWLATVGFVGVFVVVGLLQGQPSAGAATVVIVFGSVVLVATRFGLVALLALLFTKTLFYQYGVSLTPPAPLVGPTVVAIVALLAPGVFGFFTSRARGAAGSGNWLD